MIMISDDSHVQVDSIVAILGPVLELVGNFSKIVLLTSHLNASADTKSCRKVKNGDRIKDINSQGEYIGSTNDLAGKF